MNVRCVKFDRMVYMINYTDIYNQCHTYMYLCGEKKNM